MKKCKRVRTISACVDLAVLFQGPGGGGGGGKGGEGGGLCRPVLKTLNLFTIIYGFWYPISDLTLKMYTLFQTLWCVANSANSIDLRPTGLRDNPAFFFAINVHGGTRYSKRSLPGPNRQNIHPIPDQNGKIYTLFQTRNARKWYPFGRHIPWLIYGSFPSPLSPASRVTLESLYVHLRIRRLTFALEITAGELHRISGTQPAKHPPRTHRAFEVVTLILKVELMQSSAPSPLVRVVYKGVNSSTEQQRVQHIRQVAHSLEDTTKSWAYSCLTTGYLTGAKTNFFQHSVKVQNLFSLRMTHGK